MNVRRLTLTLLLITSLGATRVSARTVYYVDWDQNPPGVPTLGNSWAHAFQTLQQALGNANAGDQIWVAEGTYYPTATYEINGTIPRVEPQYRTFLIPQRVSVYGGFKGISEQFPSGESQLTQRDPEHNITILSGDTQPLPGQQPNDPPDYATFPANPRDPNNPSVELHVYDDNAYHVVTFVDPELPNTKLSGFTIRGGRAYSASGFELYGGGVIIYNVHMEPNPEHPEDPQPGAVLNRIRFEYNAAGVNGGAMFITGKPYPTYAANLDFRYNYAGSEGGAIYMANAQLFLQNAVFWNNHAVMNGGGAAIIEYRDPNPILSSYAILHNCSFNANTAGLSGGAV